MQPLLSVVESIQDDKQPGLQNSTVNKHAYKNTLLKSQQYYVYKYFNAAYK